jgi:peptidylprolyl isomerase
MAAAKSGDTVRVHYTGTLEDGSVFDSSQNRDPLQFTIGEGQVIPGFEEAVTGMEPGQSKSATIPPEQAYGPRREEMTAVVPRDTLPETLEVSVGTRLALQQGEGQRLPVTIVEVTDETITIDGNHQLAGKALTFELELVDVV